MKESLGGDYLGKPKPGLCWCLPVRQRREVRVPTWAFFWKSAMIEKSRRTQFGCEDHKNRSSSKLPANAFIPSKDHVVSSAIQYTKDEDKPCVYVLLHEGEVVYVGQTTRLQNRLSVHAKTKVFDAYWSLSCPIECLSAYEAAMIISLNPSMNVNLPVSCEFISHAQAAKILGGHKIRTLVRVGRLDRISSVVGNVYKRDEVYKLSEGAES